MDRRGFLVAAAGLALAPEALARSRGGTPLALVTADLESHVAAVSLATGRVERRIRTVAGPRAIESVGGSVAVVAHTSEGVVTLIDAVTLSVRKVLRGFGEPRYAAGDALSRVAYVSDSKRGEVAVVDLHRGRVVARTDVGGPARHITLSRDGRTLWTALGTKAERVAVLDVDDVRRPRLLRTIDPPYLGHDVGFTPGGARAWVTSGDRRTIGVYDTRSAELLFRIAADAPPQHVTFIGRRAYVTSGDDATFRVHALDGRLVRIAPVPVGSYNVQEGWGVVLTPSLARGTLSVLDAAGRLMRQVQVARSSHDACFVMSA